MEVSFAEQGKRRSFLGGLFRRPRHQKSSESHREEDEEEEELRAQGGTTSAVPEGKKVKIACSNINAIVLQLGHLGSDKDATSDIAPCFCSGCNAAASCLSNFNTANGRTDWEW